MNPKVNTTTTFAAKNTIQPIYTGGDVALDAEGHIVVTCLGEDALLTDLSSGRPLARLEGDGEILTALQITPSGSHVITCSRSLSMRIFSLQRSDGISIELNPVLQRTLKPHSTPVVSVAIDRTGTLLATGSADGVVKVWDIRGGYVSHTFRGHTGVVSALTFFEANVPQKENGIAAEKRRKSRKQGYNGDSMVIEQAQINGGDQTLSFRLASGSEDGKVRVWDLAKRKAVSILDSHVSVVRGISFLPEQNILVTASRDKTVILWNAHTWKVQKVIPVLEGLESVGYLEDGRFIYTGGESGILRVWDAESGREVTQEQEVRGEADGIINILYNKLSNFLICVHADQSLIFHSYASLSSLEPGGFIDPLPIIRRISGTHDEIIDLAYVTPDRALLALATNSEHIRLVSLATGDKSTGSSASEHYFGADVALLQGHEDIIICLDVDWSGCWLATGAKDNTAKLWRIDHINNSYENFATFTGHAESIGAISLPVDLPAVGSVANSDPLSHPPIFLLTGSQDRTIKKWDISPKQSSKTDRKSPRALYTRRAHDKDINAIASNHNSTLFASASQDRTVKIWSIEEGEVQGVLRGHRRGVWSVKFAPKDAPTITGDSGSVSSSRGLVLTGSGDKTVKIWSLNDYSCLHTLEGHTNSVLKVLWMSPSPPSQSTDSSASTQRLNKRPSFQIASAGGDGLVKIWDINTAECVCTLDNHTDRVWALALNPTDNTLISGGADSVVTFWQDTTSTTAATIAASSTARIEQEQELQNHIHRGSYREAITLALQLNHPARLLALFTSVTNTYPPEPGSLSGLLAVDDVLASLADSQIFTLLLRLRDWNTNARTAPVAQRILWVLVKKYPAERLSSLKGKAGRGGLKEVLEGLRAYTERHYRRIEELVDESYLVDFTLREMEEVGFVGGEGEGEGEGKGAEGGEKDVIMLEG